jgi:uncharacterized protein involved in exopolysaccharide biosynthesis
MKGPDPKTSAGLSELEFENSLGPENREALAGEETTQQDFRKPLTLAQPVASLRLLWESRRFLALVTGAGLLLSALIALLTPSRYTSVARLMPPDNQSTSDLAMLAAALSGGATGVGVMAGGPLGLKSTSDLLVGILNSRTVADKLIQEFDLRNVYRVRRMDDARELLAAQSGIAIGRRDGIISIYVTDKSPQMAAALAQAYVEELNRTVVEMSTSAARRERIFLERRLQAVNQDLEAAEKEFSQFASKNTAIDTQEQGKAMVGAAATLQRQYMVERSKLEGLRQLYADGDVRVRTLQARVAELEGQLQKVGRKDESAFLANTTQGNSLYPSIRELPLLGAPYADLYRKTKVQEEVFETLTQEYELAKVQEAKEIPTVKVLDSPNIPEKRSSPLRRAIVLRGTAWAFACAVIWVFSRRLWEQWDPSTPGKVLAQEVFDTSKMAMPWASRKGFLRRTTSRKAGGDVDPPEVEKEASK